MRRLVLLLAALAVACQPSVPQATAPSEGTSDGPRLGAPEAGGVPQDVAAFLEATDAEAVEWQDEPHLAQISVELDDGGRWLEAEALYVAAEADRLLSLEASADGLAEQRTTLATLQLQPLTFEAVEAVPPLPDDLLEPAALLESGADAINECLGAPPTTVLYSTGAPFAWDGVQWTQQPQWTATVSTADASIVLDPQDATGAHCVAS